MFSKNINIKWKLTLWSAFLMLFLFFSYNILQYFVIENWAINNEKQTIQKKMEEVTAYLHDYSFKKDINESEDYLDVLNEEYQMIRIVDQTGSPLFTISDEVPQNLVVPKYVTREELVELTPEEDRMLIYRAPIKVNGFVGTVEIVRNMEKFENLVDQIVILIVVTGVAAIFLSLLGGRLISYQLLKPVNSMLKTMKRIKENGLNERVPVKRNKDEMTELGTMFNELIDNLETSFHQQQQFIGDASHELKTPLSVIHGHLSLINRWGKDNPEVLERSLRLSLNETNRLIHLVSELLTLSRIEETNSMKGTMENIKVKSVIEDIVENFKVVSDGYQISSDLVISEDRTLNILKSHFEQIMIILLDNAIKYSKDEQVIQINAKEINQQLIIEVKDNGIGIEKEELEFVVNRLYRVDKARSRKQGGNGLGLSIAKGLLDMYEGSIEIDSVYGEWAKAKITFPIDDKKGKR